MYYFEDLMSEAVLLNSKSAQINKLFDYSMRQIFSSGYYKKLDKLFRGNKIEVNEFKATNNMVAYTSNGKLFVNAPVFYNKKRSDAIVYILHEMIHLISNKIGFGEIKRIENELYNLVKRNLKKAYSYSEFLTGKKQPLHSDVKAECLSYIMNGSIDWEAAKPGTKEEYKEILKRSGIFKMSSPFWHKRFK